MTEQDQKSAPKPKAAARRTVVGATANFFVGAMGLSPTDIKDRVGYETQKRALPYFVQLLKPRKKSDYRQDTWDDVAAKYQLTPERIASLRWQMSFEAIASLLVMFVCAYSLGGSIRQGAYWEAMTMAPFMLICSVFAVRSLFRRAQLKHRQLFSLGEWLRNSAYWF